MRRLAWAALLLFVVACAPDEYQCRADRECVGGSGDFGLCLVNHCAFRDKGCTGGYRWDDSAGSMRNACADPQTVGGHLDAGVAGADAPFATPDAPLVTPDAPAAAPDAPLAGPDAP